MQELELITTGACAQNVSDCLLELGALAITLRDAKDNPIFEPKPETLPLWPSIKLSALFTSHINLDQLLLQLYSSVDAIEIKHAHVINVAQQDWVRETQMQFQPMCFGERLWVYPSWDTPPDNAKIKILLDPGLAFGTGTHPTTALMLTWLALHFAPHQNVIDYGCGSGILGIAALKLGANHVWSTDIDPQALTAVRENARRNGIADTQLLTCFPEELPGDLQVDVILANILAEPLQALAECFANLVRPGGWVVLSGILTTQIEDICSIYQQWFSLEASHYQAEWASLVWKRHDLNKYQRTQNTRHSREGGNPSAKRLYKDGFPPSRE